MRTCKILATAALLTAAAVTLAGCGGTKTGSASKSESGILSQLSQDEGTATDGATSSSDGSSGAGGTSQVSIRIANLYVSDAGKPGPGIDVYDTVLTGQPATPILTNVPYGTFSAYIKPHFQIGVTAEVSLEALPTGADPVADHSEAFDFSDVTEDGSHPQLTVVLENQGSGTDPSSPLDEIASQTFVEKGDIGNNPSVPGTNAGPAGPTPPAGQGELLASTAALTGDNVSGHNYYLLVDDACTAPLNGDDNAPGLPEIFAKSGAAASQFALFPTAAGTHQVSVVGSATFDTPTCAQLTAKQGTTSVDLTAGQQALVFVYGTSLTDLHLAVGPIQS